MSGFNPGAADKVSAALTCGAADKDKLAARMLPKGTSGRGGISNPPCMADAKEEMPKEKQQRKSDRICGVFFSPYFIRGERTDKCRYSERHPREKKHALCYGAMPDFPNNREAL